MPYKSVDELPPQFNKYSAKGKRAALQTFNNVYSKASESQAFASAHNAAKRADGKPVKKSKGSTRSPSYRQVDDHDADD